MNEKAKKFWTWFKENCDSYLELDKVDKDLKEQLLDCLECKLHEYCEKLYFEIGGIPGEKQELIITAEGKVDFFEQVEFLINSAPVIDNWSFIAFIQPQGGENTINFEGVELKPAEIWFLPLQSASNPLSVGIRVCTSNFEQVKQNEWFKAAVYKTLDTVLGEKSFALDINHVDFGPLPSKPEDNGMIELAELPAYVKWKKSKLATLQ
jgi:hypothetical protein